MTWMSQQLRKNVQRTVRADCASFTGSDGCLVCGTCMYFRELLPEQEPERCAWAEHAVLPSEPSVESQYIEKLSDYLGTNTQSATDKCRRCKREFTKSSNRNVHCKACRDNSARESNTSRKRRYRSKRLNQG